jgi:tetratricopeptide (TPR) repeat protein
VTSADHTSSLAKVPTRWRVGITASVALFATAVVVASRLVARAPAEEPWRGVEFAGCAAVARGPVCEIGEREKLRFWVPQEGTAGAADAPVRLEADGHGLDAQTTRGVQGGALVVASVPPGTREVRVVQGARVFRLAVRDAVPVAWLDHVQSLRDEGKLDEARAAIEARATAKDGDRTRARATGLLARIHLAQGNLEVAVKDLREAIALDRASGALSAEADDTFALVYTLDQRLYRYDDAREALSTVAAVLAEYPEGRARHPYYEGLLVADTYELYAALQRFKDAEHRAERLGMTRLQRNAQISYALILAVMGRRTDALALLHELAARSEPRAREGAEVVPPCDRVDVHDAIGIWTLRSLDVGEPAALSPQVAEGPHSRGLSPSTRAPVAPRVVPLPVSASLDVAERAWASASALFPAACPDVNRHAGVLLGLADVALRRGDLALARSRLDEARGTLATPRSAVALTASSLEARLDLQEGHADRALAAYDALARATGATLLPEWHYATALGRGEALEALGRFADALASYEEAEATVNDQSLFIPFTEGRASFLADRERSARLRIDLLLRTGHAAESLAAARASRARPLAAFQRAALVERLAPEPRKQWERSIQAYRRVRDELERDAADAWKWSAEHAAREGARRQAKNAELRAALDSAFSALAFQAPVVDPPPPPRPGELIVTFHPGRDGWIGFGSSLEGVTAFRFEEPPPGASPGDLSERLLAPLRPAIARASYLRFLASGSLRTVDFQALPWEDGQLLDRVSVSYGFDAPSPAASASPAGSAGARVALVVADPTSDLPVAKRESEEISAILRAQPGWSVTFLVNDQASSARVRDALGTAALFHYAGHGWFGGRAGFESALGLAEGGSLTVGDVLALPRAPALVVLAACETARSTDDTGGEGLGLAHAFLAAGARGVVAPMRAVEDSLAARVSGALYASMVTKEFDAALALRNAQRAVRATAPDADWAAFRLVVP